MEYVVEFEDNLYKVWENGNLLIELNLSKSDKVTKVLYKLIESIKSEAICFDYTKIY